MRARMENTRPSAVVSLSDGTSGGGGGGGMDSSVSRMNFPRFTGDVRFAYEETVRILP